jgi:Cdc6-like AAA superfamily ATPase
MDIFDYLNHREQAINKAGERIKDFRVFDFNYIPDKPLVRDEARPIIDAILKYKQTGLANHLLITGSRGCGKTLLVKYLIKLLTQRQIQFVYANCRLHNSSFKILAHFLNTRPRGYALNELWQKFSETYHHPTVLVLDEVDLISDKDRNKEILYLASRSEQNYMLILLSNNPKFLSTLDESIKSSLQPENIFFKNYTPAEIIQILTQRAECGLTDTDLSKISQVAALTTRETNSDVRIAIKTLYYHALNPTQEIAEIFQKAKHDIVTDLLNDLNDKNLLILKAALDDPDKYVKSIYPRYKQISQSMGEEPFSYVHFYNNLSYLQSLGLILLISTKVARSYTNRVQILFNPESFESVLQRRFL